MKYIISFLLIIFYYPTWANDVKKIEIVVPHAPGGVSDLTARIVSGVLEKSIVINRPGGNSQIGIQYIKKNPSVLIVTATQVFVGNRFIANALNYDPDKDLEIIATIGIMPSVLLCNKNSGISSVDDLKNADEMTKNFAIGGYGSNEHLATEFLFHQIGKKQKLIPFSSGGAGQILSVIGGHVDCLFSNYPTVKNQLLHENINVLLISHDIEKNIPTWQQIFHAPFPMQSYSLLVVSTNLDSNIKKSFKKSLEAIVTNYKNEIDKQLSEIGLYSQFSTLDKDIKKVIGINQSVVEFIIKNNISLSSLTNP